MDRETAQMFYRAFMMICRYLEKKYGFGKPYVAGDYDFLDRDNPHEK